MVAIQKIGFERATLERMIKSAVLGNAALPTRPLIQAQAAVRQLRQLGLCPAVRLGQLEKEPLRATVHQPSLLARRLGPYSSTWRNTGDEDEVSMCS